MIEKHSEREAANWTGNSTDDYREISYFAWRHRFATFGADESGRVGDGPQMGSMRSSRLS